MSDNYEIVSDVFGVQGKLPKIINTKSQDVGDKVSYRGLELVWQGWFAATDHTKLVGRWVTYKDGLGYCASYPGATQVYKPGQILDIFVKENQIFPCIENFMDNPNLVKQCKLDALVRLQRLIDKEIFGESLDLPIGDK